MLLRNWIEFAVSRLPNFSMKIKVYPIDNLIDKIRDMDSENRWDSSSKT